MCQRVPSPFQHTFSPSAHPIAALLVLKPLQGTPSCHTGKSTPADPGWWPPPLSSSLTVKCQVPTTSTEQRAKTDVCNNVTHVFVHTYSYYYLITRTYLTRKYASDSRRRGPLHTTLRLWHCPSKDAGRKTTYTRYKSTLRSTEYEEYSYPYSLLLYTYVHTYIHTYATQTAVSVVDRTAMPRQMTNSQGKASKPRFLYIPIAAAPCIPSPRFICHRALVIHRTLATTATRLRELVPWRHRSTQELPRCAKKTWEKENAHWVPGQQVATKRAKEMATQSSDALR